MNTCRIPEHCIASRILVWTLVAYMSIFQVAPLVMAAEDAAPAENAEPEQTEQSETSDTSDSSDEMIHEMPSDMPPGVFTLGVMGHDEEVEGFGNVLVPVYYDGESTLLFVTPRFTAGDNDEEELNVGIGARYLCPNAHVIIGANAFYDYRWTENDSEWSQYGFGVELLTEWVDARANYYLPEDDKELVDEYETVETSTSSSTDVDYGGIYAQGNGLYQEIVTTRRTTKTTVTKTFRQWEAAMEGYDAEIGVKLPYISNIAETRVFVGYQSFDNPFGEDFKGAKGRLEVRALPGLYLDAELYENEDLNGADYAVGARLNLPLDLAGAAHGENPFAGAGHNFDPSSDQRFVNRMTEMVIRDLKIRTSRSEFEEAVDMRTTDTDTDTDRDEETITVMNELTFVDQDNAGDPLENGTAEHPYDVIDEGIGTAVGTGGNRVYIFDAAAEYEDNITIPDDVSLYGNGSPIRGLGGRTFGNGVYPIVNGGRQGPTFIMGNNTLLAGFQIRNNNIGIPASGPTQDPIFTLSGYRRYGVYAGNVTDFTVMNNIVEDCTRGITLMSDTPDFSAVVRNNTIYDLNTSGIRVRGEGAGGIMDITLEGNTIYDAGAAGLRIRGRDYDVVNVLAQNNTIYNSGTKGMWIDVDRTLLANVDLIDNDSSDNTEEGVYITGTGASGTYNLLISGATGNGNQTYGLQTAIIDYDQINATVQQSTFNGNTVGNILMNHQAAEDDSSLMLTDVDAINSPGFGVQVFNYAHDDDGDGNGGQALLTLNNVDAGHNTAFNMQLFNYAYEDSAILTVMDSRTDGALPGGFGVQIFNYALDNNSDGNAGLAITTIDGLNADNNDSFNGQIFNYACEGNALLTVMDSSARSSVTGTGMDFYNYALDVNNDGVSGSAYLIVDGFDAGHNQAYNMYVYNRSDENFAFLGIYDSQADGSLSSFGAYIRNYANDDIGDGTSGNAHTYIDGLDAGDNSSYNLDVLNQSAENSANLTVLYSMADNSVGSYGAQLYNYANDDQADGGNGYAQTLIDGLDAGHNQSFNLMAYNYSLNGSGTIGVYDSRADGSLGSYGAQLFNYAQDSDGDGVGGPANMTISGLDAGDNDAFNLQAYNYSYENYASMTVLDTLADNSANSFGAQFFNYAQDNNGDGTGNNALMALDNVDAGHNQAFNLMAYNYSYENSAIMSASDIMADGSLTSYGAQFYNFAQDNQADGGTGYGSLTLDNIDASGNTAFNLEARNQAHAGNGLVVVQNSRADGSLGSFGATIRNLAYDGDSDGVSGAANMVIDNLDAGDNNGFNLNVYNMSQENYAQMNVLNSMADHSAGSFGAQIMNYAQDNAGDGTSGNAVLTIDNLDAGHNQGLNLDVVNDSAENSAILTVQNSRADRSATAGGASMINDAGDDQADGNGGYASLTIDNLNADGNNQFNLYTMNRAYAGNAMQTVINSDASGSVNEYGMSLNNWAYDGDADEASGSAMLYMDNLTANNNNLYNLYAYNLSMENNALMLLNNGQFNGSQTSYGMNLQNHAADGGAADGTSGNARLDVANVQANGNSQHNAEMYSYAYDGSGDGMISVSNSSFNNSVNSFGAAFLAQALDTDTDGTSGNADLRIYQVSANGNNLDGIAIGGARSFGTTSDAHITLENSRMRDNGNLGALLELDAGDTASLFGVGNVIRNNGDDGIQIDADAGVYDLNMGRAGVSAGENSIFGNTGFDLNNIGGGTVDAENNWWGSPADPAAQINGAVDYTPWRASAP